MAWSECNRERYDPRTNLLLMDESTITWYRPSTIISTPIQQQQRAQSVYLSRTGMKMMSKVIRVVRCSTNRTVAIGRLVVMAAASVTSPALWGCCCSSWSDINIVMTQILLLHVDIIHRVVFAAIHGRSLWLIDSDFGGVIIEKLYGVFVTTILFFV